MLLFFLSNLYNLDLFCKSLILRLHCMYSSTFHNCMYHNLHNNGWDVLFRASPTFSPSLITMKTVWVLLTLASMFFVCGLCSLKTKHLLYTLILSPWNSFWICCPTCQRTLYSFILLPLKVKTTSYFTSKTWAYSGIKQNCNPRQTSCSKTIGKSGNKGEGCFLRRKGVSRESCYKLKSTGVTW